jgi:hypothetical protein
MLVSFEDSGIKCPVVTDNCSSGMDPLLHIRDPCIRCSALDGDKECLTTSSYNATELPTVFYVVSYVSVSQPMVRGPLVVREDGAAGPQT